MAHPTTIYGAVSAEQGEIVDRLFDRIVNELRADGFSVCGVIQRRADTCNTCCADMGLELLSTGEVFEISQPLGKESQGCRLDPRGLAELTPRLMRELDDQPDLLLLNRFGKGEQEGQGFRQLIGYAIERSVPVLTAVRPPYRDAWRIFAGDLAAELPPEREAILAWCRQVKPSSHSLPSSALARQSSVHSRGADTLR